MAIRHSRLAIPLFFFLLWVVPSAAHMSMSEPPPINYKTNPNYNSAKGDFDYSAPLSPSGSNYPCKGHLKDLDAPEGRPVRTYAQGGTYNMVISGSAVHGGGSCQCSLSYDKGKTFTVIKSFIGNCPHATPGGDQTFKFTIPKDAPSGNAVFAWTWFNKIGNREMYMNCASVTIGGGAKSRAMAKRAYSGPEVFKANIGNGCTTAAGTDVVFPNLGPNPEYGGDTGARAPPSGSCQGQALTGGGNSGTSRGSGGSGSGSGSGTGTGTGAGAGASGTGASGSSVGGGSGGTGATGGDTGGAGTGTTGGGAEDSGNTGPSSVQDTQGCAYWRAQGYVCSGASKSLLGRKELFQMFVGVLLVLAISGL